MSRIAYVNGAYVPYAAAHVRIDDRGFQFADGVYEVWGVRDGALMDLDAHFDRLERSLRELRISAPMTRRSLNVVVREIVRRNHVRDGLAYLQISRGAAPRDHVFPLGISASLVATARSIDRRALAKRAELGVSVITLPDIRWGRCDIKSVALLPNVLAKQAAREAGAYEAWLVDDQGFVTEGAATSAWIVAADGDVITRPLDNHILPGVTRGALIEAAAEMQISIVERRFSVAEALAAREAFISSASGPALPVIAIDGCAIGSGKPGPLTARLRGAYLGRQD